MLMVGRIHGKADRELNSWRVLRLCLKLLMSEDIDVETLREKNPNKLVPPLHGALLKNEQDIQLFERLAFLARRENS